MRIERSRGTRPGNTGRKAILGALTFAVLTSSLGVPAAVAAPTTPGPKAANAQAPLEESTTDEKSRAAAALGINAHEDMLVLDDRNFVLALWRKAKEGSEVKSAALMAFTSSDGYASTRFIKTGVYQAKKTDADNEVKDSVAKQQARAAKRNAVAQVPGMEATDEVVNLGEKEFVFRVWQNAKAGSAVKNAAADVLRPQSTPEDRQKFVTKGIYDARELDRQREITDTQEAERKAKELEQSRVAKTLAVSAALGLVADDDTKNLSDRDFVTMIWTRTTGAEVKIAARAALDTNTPLALKDFIFTGVHSAHQRDLEALNTKDLALKSRQAREILDAAERDGFQPNLVTAAKLALKDPTLAKLTAFLDKEQHEAAKRDFAKPAQGLVVELKGLQSGRCLQVAGVNQDAKRDGAGTELWDCVRGAKQRWVLQDKNDGRYALRNVNSQKCLAVAGGGIGDNDALVQVDCTPGSPEQLWEFVPVGDDGLFELRNVKSGKAAGAAGGGTANASLVVQYTNTHAAGQAWRLVDVNHNSQALVMRPGVAELKGVQSQRCLQVAGVNQDSLADGAGTELWDCAGSGQRWPKERWTLVGLADNQYTIKNVNSGLCLDIEGGQATDGATVVQARCQPGPSQRWAFFPGGNDAMKVVNALTGGVLTAANAGTANGSPIQQFADGNGDEQQWLVNPLP